MIVKKREEHQSSVISPFSFSLIPALVLLQTAPVIRQDSDHPDITMTETFYSPDGSLVSWQLTSKVLSLSPSLPAWPSLIQGRDRASVNSDFSHGSAWMFHPICLFKAGTECPRELTCTQSLPNSGHSLEKDLRLTHGRGIGNRHMRFC